MHIYIYLLDRVNFNIYYFFGRIYSYKVKHSILPEKFLKKIAFSHKLISQILFSNVCFFYIFWDQSFVFRPFEKRFEIDLV